MSPDCPQTHDSFFLLSQMLGLKGYTHHTISTDPRDLASPEIMGNTSRCEENGCGMKEYFLYWILAVFTQSSSFPLQPVSYICKARLRNFTIAHKDLHSLISTTSTPTSVHQQLCPLLRGNISICCNQFRTHLLTLTVLAGKSHLFSSPHTKRRHSVIHKKPPRHHDFMELQLATPHPLPSLLPRFNIWLCS